MSLSTMKRATASVLSIWCPSVQNGVVDNNAFIHCLGSPTGAADPNATTSPKAATDNEVDNGEADRCPCAMEPEKNVRVKPLVLGNRFPESTNEDGSLPSSPETPSGCGKMPTFPAGPNGRLDQETQELIYVLYRIHTGLSRPGSSRNKALATMKRVVEDVIEKHHYAYKGMIQKVCLDQQGDDMNFVTYIAKNIFSDGTTNWGRIASLVAFGAELCRHLKEKGREHCVDLVSQEICSYLLSDQRDWLINNKGWEGFVEFFHVEDPESVVRNALMAIAGVAGIGAGLAFLIR
ncbi:induced myeloid leukemia cell differentiation protein Mcl-1b [Megalops cyprinoides]|uniref:induced myeloid leukemia cell differentiation protein Mcl-1b n=1 Tax=Megalops cyprinoides TaxID=118141 RepID=UPI0018642BFF|nr:induced myeloid leukemia cell differentiation protein Mcl-1b [Megalops cyprinoides]